MRAPILRTVAVAGSFACSALSGQAKTLGFHAICPNALSVRGGKTLARSTILNSAVASEVVAESTGEGENYRVFFKSNGETISPWHDVPLSSNKDTFNFITEIPKYGLAKMECATKEEKNPIKQDEKKGKLRFYHGPIFWNYGFLPQTFEDPDLEHPELKCNGDGDPLDVVEIGSEKLAEGSITEVKPLGTLAMIDDGEVDWKVIAINKADPLAAELQDINDVEEKLPGVVSGIREWFRWYKTPDDKPLNAFGFGEKALNRAETLAVIEETHEQWKELCEKDQAKFWTK